MSMPVNVPFAKKGCAYDCNCWFEADFQGQKAFCINCTFFKTESIATASRQDKAYMRLNGLDVLYICEKRHFIRHAYSGRCSDHIMKLHNFTHGASRSFLRKGKGN